MKEKYTFRQATKEEISEIFALILSRMAWMDRVGIQQWNATKYDKRYPMDYYEMRQEQGELFVMREADSGKLLCVGGLLRDDARWIEKASALYLHHFASRPEDKGAGSIFLQMAEEYAARQGMEYMRLDSAIGNEKLEYYYRSRGYEEAGFCRDGVYEGILRQKKLPERTEEKRSKQVKI